MNESAGPVIDALEQALRRHIITVADRLRVRTDDGTIASGMYHALGARELEIITPAGTQSIDRARITRIDKRETAVKPVGCTFAVLAGVSLAAMCNGMSRYPRPGEVQTGGGFYLTIIGLVVGIAFGAMLGAVVGFFIPRWVTIHSSPERVS